jgi:predicted TPR repeat methyltransferase
MPALDLGQALAKAFAALDAGRTDEARRLARQVEKQRPDLPGLAYLLGLVALAEGQGRRAAQHLAKALARTPDAVPPLLAMARAQGAQERFAAAERLYRRLLILAPDLAAAHAELGESLLRQQRHAEALAPLGRAARLHPADARSLNALGVVWKALGHWDQAALAFAGAIDADAASVKAHANLAAVLRRLKRTAEAVEMARRATELDGADALAWMERGLAERDAGDGAAALQSFARARTLAPASPEILWLEAECLVGLGRAAEAEPLYRSLLAEDPADRFGAALALARLAGETPASGAPAAFVAGLFDQYAESFDKDLRDNLGYRAPEILAEAVARTLGRGPFDCLDAGCGTGLAGVALKPLLSRLDGVDLSPRMIEKARQRGIYDRLDADDLVTVLESRPAAYDLVAAADVLIYLGDLTALFQAAWQALKGGGGFAFTTECHDGETFLLQESRRISHGEAYLRRLAVETGFEVLALQRVSVRRDRDQPVPGCVAVLRKASTGD